VTEAIFRETAGRYTPDSKLVDSLWTELYTAYTAGGRHYHSLRHLDHLLGELLAVKDRLLHWDDVVFATFYHDAVYASRKQDNEERSADMARERLTRLRYPKEGINHCVQLILATKGHSAASDVDVNIFTDADLSILGAAEAEYDRYAGNVRKEYSVYPDFLYKPGRKKVLEHFLAMPRIFKTEIFFDRYELPARENLRRELRVLES